MLKISGKGIGFALWQPGLQGQNLFANIRLRRNLLQNCAITADRGSILHVFNEAGKRIYCSKPDLLYPL